jgi:type IV secretory pathway VirJ component
MPTPLRGSAAIASIFLAIAAAVPLARAETVPVATSRGPLDLRVFSPVAPPMGAETPPLVLLISGEGGWRSFDDMLADTLTGAGYWVGGLDAMRYFWKAQDDRAALARDVRACVASLASRAGRRADAGVLIAGFSFGADLAPWVAGSGGFREQVRGLVMISPDETGSLEFRVSELIGFESKEHTFSVSEALRGAAGIPVLLLHGEKDTKSAAGALAASAADPKRLVVVPEANHHFVGQEEKLRAQLLAGIEWLRTAR